MRSNREHCVDDQSQEVVKSGLVAVSVIPDEESPLLGTVNIHSEQDGQGEGVVISEHSARYARSLQRLTFHIFIPFSLYCLAVGAVAAPKINIVLTLMCIKHNPGISKESIRNDYICTTPSAHTDMARFMVYANLVSGVLCAISSPRIGALSDRYGRKPLIDFSVLGILFGDTVSLVASLHADRFPAYWMLAEYVFGGLTGAFLTTVALTQSYVADSTLQHQRTRAFSILHACMYSGQGLGPALGALFIRQFGQGDMSSAFLAAGVCHLLFMGHILFIVPESLLCMKVPTASSGELSDTIDDTISKGGNRWHFRHIFQPLKVLRLPSKLSKNHGMSLSTLATIDTFAFGVQVGLPALLVLYSEHQFGWQNFEASLLQSVTNITRAVVLGLLLPFAMRRIEFKRQDHENSTDGLWTEDQFSRSLKASTKVVLTAVLLEAIGQIGFALSTVSASFISSAIVAAAASPISPVAQSLMTFHVEPEKLGELFGAVSLLHAIARAVIPASMQMVYSVTVANVSGTVFWALGALFTIILLRSIYIR